MNILSFQELYSLMFSLDWVKEKAQFMGSAHLINDYVEYGEILDKEVFILLSFNFYWYSLQFHVLISLDCSNKVFT